MTTIQIRIDGEEKKNAQKILKNLGLDMSSAIKIFLKTVIREKGIPFPLNEGNISPDKLRHESRMAKKGKSFSSSEELLDDLLTEK